MSTSEIGMLALIVGALSLFAGAVGWASWMEMREEKLKRGHESASAPGGSKGG